MSSNGIFARLLRPNNPSKPYGATRLTRELARAVAGLFTLFFVLSIVASLGPADPKHPSPLFFASLAVFLVDFLLVPAAIASFVRDLTVGNARRREDKRSSAMAVERWEQDQAEAAVQQEVSLKGSLSAIYDQHNDALVAQMQKILQPDRYGQRDVSAAAREFNYFQEQVAKPELERSGFPAALIDHIFGEERDRLLGAVLGKV